MYFVAGRLINKPKCLELFAAYARNKYYKWIDAFHRDLITPEDQQYIAEHKPPENAYICSLDSVVKHPEAKEHCILMCDAVYYPCVLHKALEINGEVLSIHHEYFVEHGTIDVPYYFCEGQFSYDGDYVMANYKGGGFYRHRNFRHNTDLNNVYTRICDCGNVTYYTF